LIDRLQGLGLRALTICAGLLLALAGVWWSEQAGLLEPRWINVTLCSVSALFIGTAGVWVQRRIQAERRREARCSFCGQSGHDGADLERAPRFAGAAICARCASIIARRHALPETQADSPNVVGNANSDSVDVANDAATISGAPSAAKVRVTSNSEANAEVARQAAQSTAGKNGRAQPFNDNRAASTTTAANAVAHEEDYD